MLVFSKAVYCQKRKEDHPWARENKKRARCLSRLSALNWIVWSCDYIALSGCWSHHGYHREISTDPIYPIVFEFSGHSGILFPRFRPSVCDTQHFSFDIAMCQCAVVTLQDVQCTTWCQFFFAGWYKRENSQGSDILWLIYKETWFILPLTH